MKSKNPTADNGIKINASVKDMENAILRRLETSLARAREVASIRDWWVATALAIRDFTMGNFIKTMKRLNDGDARRVYYMSLEYLVGRLTEDTLVNIGLLDTTKKALENLGLKFEDVIGAAPIPCP